MTTLSSWSYTRKLTFWSSTRDAYNQPVYSLEFTALGTWKAGGDRQASDDGVQFVPAATYWIERGPNDPRPQREWIVAVGELTGQPPITAEMIKKVGCDDDGMHGFDSVDWVMWT